MQDTPPIVHPDLRYTRYHMWVRVEGPYARVGVTDLAQRSLGELVFLDLPAVGRSVELGGDFAWLESTKAVVDLFPPVRGIVREVNSALFDNPRPVNEDPYGGGWLCVIEPADPRDTLALMDANEYSKLTESGA